MARRPPHSPRHRADVPTILALIKGLAEYERPGPRGARHSGGLCAAMASARGRYFETLIGSRGRTPVGFALYFFTYSTFLARPSLYLEDLFVVPEERGRGAGARCWASWRALPSGAAAGAWSGRCSTGTPRRSASTRSWGAQLKREWILTRLTGEPLQRLAREARKG